MPLVGTWIEMAARAPEKQEAPSCPSWARGLKYHPQELMMIYNVVPLVGTWIEIKLGFGLIGVVGRAPRGHVD